MFDSLEIPKPFEGAPGFFIRGDIIWLFAMLLAPFNVYHCFKRVTQFLMPSAPDLDEKCYGYY
jgi:hypothetical protein